LKALYTDPPTDKAWAPLPTYPVVLGLKGMCTNSLLSHKSANIAAGAENDVNLFAAKVRANSIPGLPKLDSRRIVRMSLSLLDRKLTGRY
jgi:hypothetical protein